MKKVVDRILHHPHQTQSSPHHHHETKHGSVHTDITDSSGMVIHRKVESPLEETIVKPTIVEEETIEEEVIEVQPIIHRVIEVPEIHHIEKHIYEKVLPIGPHVITKEPIVDITIQPHIVEEVTTIVHREVPEINVVHEEQHIAEHTTRPVIHTTQTIYGDTLEINTTDSHLRAIAAPHERTQIIRDTAVTDMSRVNSTQQQWMNAYPRAMRTHDQHTHHAHHEHQSHHTHKADDKRGSGSAHEGKWEKHEEGERLSEPNKSWKQALPKAMEAMKLQETETREEFREESREEIREPEEPRLERRAKGKEKVIAHDFTEHFAPIQEEEEGEVNGSSRALWDANSPEGAHEQDNNPSLDHPVYIYREPEHSSLDIRAQFSLERAADLQAANAFGDLPGFSAKPHIRIDRGNDDLERGSNIGLASPPKHHSPPQHHQQQPQHHQQQQHTKQHDKQEQEQAYSPKLKPEKERSEPTKLERELRHANADMAGAFVVHAVKPENQF